MKKVKRIPISQGVTEQLIDLIMSGELPKGEKLPPEKELKDIFGVGRSSLREAIKAVEALGLLEVRVPEGTFVSEDLGGFFTKQLALMSKIGFNNISELIEARKTIETQTAILAAKKATDADIEELSTILNKMKQYKNDSDFQKYDLGFHKKVTEMSRNSFLIQVMKILQEITSLWIKKVIPLENTKPVAIKQHNSIFEAIKNNDTKATSSAMEIHLKHVGDLLILVNENEQKDKK